MKKLLIHLAIALNSVAVQAQIDRAGNILDDGDSGLSGPAILFMVLSGLVLHFAGERALFKMWGGFFLIAAIIGLTRKFS
ncbi:hypothetical protein [Limnohabitans sp. DM1]|uniref:hypothetical protein n=1 Tax=Limnohabitans sp. DM1 TaxID=1597955 RepID=UPI000B7E5BF3|nr:hypothetical protein [Limnohabitans sp. DM1]